MGKRKYPPLSPGEVVSIIKALGFTFKRQDGSHAHYELAAAAGRERKLVTVDMSVSPFNEYLLKSMIRQSGFSREAFYGATEKTAKKIR
jgi:predicted RNA binding protein YcfA (HicA-like mRNA interferase family)